MLSHKEANLCIPMKAMFGRLHNPLGCALWCFAHGVETTQLNMMSVEIINSNTHQFKVSANLPS